MGLPGIGRFSYFCDRITEWTPGLGVDQAIHLSILVLGVFVLLHLGIDLVWAKIQPNKHNLSLASSSQVQLAGALLTAPTVVLGLLAAFHQPLPLAVEVGAVSLAFGVLIGFILFGLVGVQVKQAQTPIAMDIFRSYLFNVTLWLVAFGLLCITFELVVS